MLPCNFNNFAKLPLRKVVSHSDPVCVSYFPTPLLSQRAIQLFAQCCSLRGKNFAFHCDFTLYFIIMSEVCISLIVNIFIYYRPFISFFSMKYLFM